MWPLCFQSVATPPLAMVVPHQVGWEEVRHANPLLGGWRRLSIPIRLKQAWGEEVRHVNPLLGERRRPSIPPGVRQGGGKTIQPTVQLGEGSVLPATRGLVSLATL